jgi:hypothetical protein
MHWIGNFRSFIRCASLVLAYFTYETAMGWSGWGVKLISHCHLLPTSRVMELYQWLESWTGTEPKRSEGGKKKGWLCKGLIRARPVDSPSICWLIIATACFRSSFLGIRRNESIILSFHNLPLFLSGNPTTHDRFPTSTCHSLSCVPPWRTLISIATTLSLRFVRACTANMIIFALLFTVGTWLAQELNIQHTGELHSPGSSVAGGQTNLSARLAAKLSNQKNKCRGWWMFNKLGMNLYVWMSHHIFIF